MRGVIGSEKQLFFRDPEVAAAFARHGLDVHVDIAGSREIATRVDFGRYDFGFPAGIPAAERIRRQRKVTAFYQPFYTPMVVATFKPIAELLRKAGLASPLAGGYWRFDVKRYLDLVGKEAPTSRCCSPPPTCAPPTPPRCTWRSPSYVRNGDRVVENAAHGDRVVDQVAPLFLRLGSDLLLVASEGLGDDWRLSRVGCARPIMPVVDPG